MIIDQGDTLSEIGPGLRVGHFGNGLGYGGVMAGVPNPDILYAAAYTGVFVRTNIGGSLVQTVAVYPGGTPIDVAMLASNWRTAFVVDQASVFMTTNVGATWTISPAISAVSVSFGASEPGPRTGRQAFSLEPTAELTFPVLPVLGSGARSERTYRTRQFVTWSTTKWRTSCWPGTLGRGAWMITNASASVFAPAPPFIGTQPQAQSIFDRLQR